MVDNGASASPSTVPTQWEDQVMAEAMNFVNAVQQNFKHGLKVSLAYLPDQRKPEYLGRQLDIFIDAIVGLAVQLPATFASPHPELEASIVEAIGRKFAYIREQTAQAAADSSPASKGN